MKTDEKTLRHVLDLARAEINRQRPRLALEHLRTIHEQIDQLRTLPLWAEFQLIYAEALSAMNVDAAEHEFQEALSRLSKLNPREPILELRAEEHFADFLSRRGRVPLARGHYQSAESIAVDSGLREDADRIRLSTISMDLQSSNSQQWKSFQNLKKAAAECNYRHTPQLSAWIRYSDQLREQVNRGLMNAREGEIASPDFFKGLLRSIGTDPDEDTD